MQSIDSMSPQHLSKQPILGSPHPFLKGDNIVVKVLNNDNTKAPSSSQCNDADSSVILLDVCEDAKPSAPTWTSQGPTFPLNSISQNLSKNLAMDVPANSSENQSSSKIGTSVIIFCSLVVV